MKWPSCKLKMTISFHRYPQVCAVAVLFSVTESVRRLLCIVESYRVKHVLVVSLIQTAGWTSTVISCFLSHCKLHLVVTDTTSQTSWLTQWCRLWTDSRKVIGPPRCSLPLNGAEAQKSTIISSHLYFSVEFPLFHGIPGRLARKQSMSDRLGMKTERERWSFQSLLIVCSKQRWSMESWFTMRFHLRELIDSQQPKPMLICVKCTLSIRTWMLRPGRNGYHMEGKVLFIWKSLSLVNRGRMSLDWRPSTTAPSAGTNVIKFLPSPSLSVFSNPVRHNETDPDGHSRGRFQNQWLQMTKSLCFLINGPHDKHPKGNDLEPARHTFCPARGGLAQKTLCASQDLTFLLTHIDLFSWELFVTHFEASVTEWMSDGGWVWTTPNTSNTPTTALHFAVSKKKKEQT